MSLKIVIHFFVFVLCTCSLLESSAQVDQIAKLREDLAHAEDDTSKIRALYLLTYAFFSESMDSASLYAKQCWRLGQLTPYRKFQCNALAIMGSTYMYQNQYDSAEYFYNQALAMTKQTYLPQQQSALYSNLGVLYKRQELYDRAVNSYIEGLLVDEKNNNVYGMVIKKLNLSNLYSTMSDDDRALEYGYEALSACEELDHEDRLQLKSLLLNNIGTILMEKNKQEEALEKFEQALAVSREIGNANEISRNLNNIGSTLEKMGRTEAGVPLLLEALEIRKQVGDKVGLLETHLELGTAFAKIGQVEQSSFHFRESLRYGEEIGNSTFIAEIYLAMSDSRENNDQFEEALHYHKLFQAQQDSIARKYDRQAYLEMESKYQAAQKDAKIASTNLELERKTSQRNIYLFGLLTVGLISLVLLSRYRYKRRLAEEELSNLQQAQKLTAIDFMVQGQEEERKRIARDLHDGLGSQLSIIRLQVHNLQKQLSATSDDNDLSVTEKMIDQACLDVRRIAHNMMPDALVELGLVAAIQDLCTSVNETGKMIVSTYFSSEEISLGKKEDVILYRVIQEILQNSVKYSFADKLIVQLTRQNQSIHLSVEDDGIGFDNGNQSPEGLGLKNIQSRINYLNGSVNIQTGEGQGTAYEISVPLGIAATVKK